MPLVTLGKSLPFVGLSPPTCEWQLDVSSPQVHQPGAMTAMPSALALSRQDLCSEPVGSFPGRVIGSMNRL